MTGGAVRVGRAIALGLARAGMDVAIGHYRSRRDARHVVAELRAAGGRATAIRADLADPAAARRLVATAARALGGLEVLVNSAAISTAPPLPPPGSGAPNRVLDVNLRGVFFCCQAAAGAMRRRGGHIVNVGDTAAAAARPNYIPYTLSKAGIESLTRGLAVALRSRRIVVNCVAPGAVLRPAGFSAARWRRVTRSHAGSVADVVAAVLFFATCPPTSRARS